MTWDEMKRRPILISIAVAALPGIAGAVHSRTLLTVSGSIGRVNNDKTGAYKFSDAEFMKLPTVSITTGTAWTPTSVFVGPLLADVMQAAGVTAGTLMLKAMDDYSTLIPWDDLTRYGVILAHTQDGQRLTEQRWGPLWIIYPRDQNPNELKGPIAQSRFVWQVDRIEVGV